MTFSDSNTFESSVNAVDYEISINFENLSMDIQLTAGNEAIEAGGGLPALADAMNQAGYVHNTQCPKTEKDKQQDNHITAIWIVLGVIGGLVVGGLVVGGLTR